MSDTPHSVPGFPLGLQQMQAVQGLVQSLSPQQLAWLGGYLTGISGNGAAPGVMALPAAAPAAAVASTLTILYGTQTGNCEKVAKKALAAAQAKGLDAHMVEMGDYRPAQLKKETHLLVIVSTHGEGDPPDTVVDLYEHLHSARAPKLAGTKFTVLGLGDLSYEHFCQMGKDFDAKLAELGGARVAERVDCDVDYHDAAATWIAAAVEVMAADMKAHATPAVPAAQPVVYPGATSAEYDERHPYYADLLENIVLSDEGSAKETRHVELSLEGSGITYRPGDAIGILPMNDPRLVDELLLRTGLDPDGTITAHDGDFSLREALLRIYDITALTRPFVTEWAQLSDSPKLKALVADPETLGAYISDREIIDLVTDFPAQELTGPALTSMLRKLPPRLYSIASSLEAHPDEVHLCVATVRYATHGRERKGVCSTFFAERTALGDKVPIYIHHNTKFKLPDNPDTAIIMIGPGTGVAPFRAFVEEREASGAEGKSWLFFGDQHFTSDFLYQAEWLRFLETGALTRMDVAFSRDQKEKVYVQHRMLERAADLWSWLESGAHLYVCGDASRMADDVHQALLQIIREQGRHTDEQAVEFVKQMQKEKRYQRDVY